MGFETTTLRDLAGCSNYWATGDSTYGELQNLGTLKWYYDENRIFPI